MSAFALGVSTLINGVGMGVQEAIRKRANLLRVLAEQSEQNLGVTFITLGPEDYSHQTKSLTRGCWRMFQSGFRTYRSSCDP
ncbi:hypothetical protein [Sulfitobacter guttiformis]|uniref:hypothetical protein n=1 Tax=Sulfitobacter guttiformis TaxID=74349 RepID=UPI00046AFF3B|nr:hypothetical protein [Sulfitobacter guttiformis]KIN71294.1 Cytochrome c biogenesis protein transmembrane region [Sulfitobacter guttiformis KCTC 32187]